MACTPAEVRRIARSMPGLVASAEHLSFAVRVGSREKGVAWAWRERTHPRRPKVVNPDVLAVRVRDLQDKESLMALDPAKYFSEPHYDGYPAVLVRLDKVSPAELRRLLREAVLAVAPAPRPRRGR